MISDGDIQAQLGLLKPPIAVGFFAEPPNGIARWQGGSVPAGCAFWRKAQQGEAFYTQPDDHAGCAIGAYTHSLPMAQASDLEQTIETMIGADYLRPEEVAGIPTLPESPSFVAYAPAADNLFPPSVVLVTAQPAQAMLLYEAALAAGAASAVMPALGRPSCAALPLALNTNAPALSFGCRGNRLFAELPDTEMYVAIPGQHWPTVASHVAGVLAANETMDTHYQAKATAASAEV
jgi:uncharacterized protein (DUF169 family)